MFLFILLTALAMAENLIDYQLYTNSIGSEYSRVHFPEHGDKTIVNFNSRSSYSPVVTKHQDKIIARDVEYLFRNEVGFEKYFGKGDINPFVVGQLATEVNFGEVERQPLLQDKNIIAGVSMGRSDDLRLSVSVVTGTGFHNKQNSTGLLGSLGVSREKFGIATSVAIEDITNTETATKVAVGTYFVKDKNRFTIEYDKQFDKEYEPSDITVGINRSLEFNSRDVNLFSSFSHNPFGTAGAGPTVAFGFSFNLQKNKKTVDPKDIVQLEEEKQEEEIIVDTTVEVTENPEETGEPEKLIEETSIDDNSQNNQEPIGILETKQGNYSKKVKSKINSQKGEKIMPDDNTKELKAHEVQPAPTGVSTTGLSNIAQQSGGDSNLAMFLAIIAVVGGGAAWKFYSQFAEQKHEQKMKEMELQAKAQGLGAASPPPCQAAQAEMKAEIKK